MKGEQPMIPAFYDRKDRENLAADYAVETGRVITKDGRPFVRIVQCDESKESACAVDYFTHAIANYLNLYLQHAAKRKVLKKLGGY